MSLTQKIEEERFKRGMKQLRQCHCELSKSLLKPVGQQLTFLSGKSLTGKMRGEEARHIMVPTTLLDEKQQGLYTCNPGTKCMWDGELFAGMPVGCPIQQRKIRRTLANPFRHPKKTIVKFTKDGIVREPYVQTHRIDDGYRLFGYFCSWNCARAYGNIHFPREAWRIGSYIYSILLKMTNQLKEEGKLPTNYRVRAPRAAPHFTTLKSYGGIFSIEEFRKMNELDNGKELTCIPSWLAVVPAGMRVTEAPMVSASFVAQHNSDEARKLLKRKYLKTKHPPIVDAPRVAEVPNSILFCLKQARK